MVARVANPAVPPAKPDQLVNVTLDAMREGIYRYEEDGQLHSLELPADIVLRLVKLAGFRDVADAEAFAGVE